MNSAVNGMCDEDLAPRMTVIIFLQRTDSKPITFDNASSPRKQALLSKRKVKYIEYLIVERDTVNLGISGKEVIQMISDIGQARSYVQS